MLQLKISAFFWSELESEILLIFQFFVLFDWLIEEISYSI